MFNREVALVVHGHDADEVVIIDPAESKPERLNCVAIFKLR
jgi:hypothetical protein